MGQNLPDYVIEKTTSITGEKQTSRFVKGFSTVSLSSWKSIEDTRI